MKSILMLAHDFEKHPTDIKDWWWSEKLEGQRAFWDGGITRGMPKNQVPWADTEKDDRYVEEPISTGLWSRYGNVIHAPDWFLDSLPRYILDGELYLGKSISSRQSLFSAVRKISPIDSEWKPIRYHVFDTFNAVDLGCDFGWNTSNNVMPFQTYQIRLRSLQARDDLGEFVKLLDQFTVTTLDWLQKKMQEIVREGGEGIIVRDPKALYKAKRLRSLLKMKPLFDDEATMIGWNSGRLTDKGSKLLGKMGSLVVKWTNPKGQEVIFELSGFTDEERRLNWEGEQWAKEYPGCRCPDELRCESAHFEPGDLINFTYRDLTRDGMPVEARFKRIRKGD